MEDCESREAALRLEDISRIRESSYARLQREHDKQVEKAKRVTADMAGVMDGPTRERIESLLLSVLDRRLEAARASADQLINAQLSGADPTSTAHISE